MKRLALIILALALSGCAYKQRPVYNVQDPLPFSAQSLPLERIEALIIAGAEKRAWRVRREALGHLVAIQRNAKQSAEVDIQFDRQQLRITYRNSTGMLANEGLIHSHYNLWVRNLEADIRARLSAGY